MIQITQEALQQLVAEATTRAVAKYIANHAPPQPHSFVPQEEPSILEGRENRRQRMDKRTRLEEEVNSRASVPEERADLPPFPRNDGPNGRRVEHQGDGSHHLPRPTKI
ncbi:hypothetical protein Salat_2525200 [Sesamum alatum]|uniref:Uncharacterized protein n=1 Tax=Sesamum alatum TaxID=300844 RepID=A0AAE1XSX1_9LAMI|nr:hypothetical protein Salat_2525200 [Sesamum alatum]